MASFMTKMKFVTAILVTGMDNRERGWKWKKESI